MRPVRWWLPSQTFSPIGEVGIIAQRLLQPLSASASPKGRVALFSA